MYRPHLARSPMLDQAGQRQIAASLSPAGAQLGVAYSATPVLGVRGDVQLDFLSGPYLLVSVGLGRWYAGPRGLRLGLWLDGGGGVGTADLSATLSTPNGTSTSYTRLSGSLLQGSGTVELGWEGEAVATGLELRGVEQLLFHDEASDVEGMSHLTSVEALLLARLGRAPLRFQAFAGLSLPVYGDGGTGVQLPLVVGIGLVWNRERGEVR